MPPCESILLQGLKKAHLQGSTSRTFRKDRPDDLRPPNLLPSIWITLRRRQSAAVSSRGRTFNGSMPVAIPVRHVTDDDAQASRPKREKVTFACDECGLKKMRCDGIRPVCRACFRRYGSEAPLLRASAFICQRRAQRPPHPDRGELLRKAWHGCMF